MSKNLELSATKIKNTSNGVTMTRASRTPAPKPERRRP